MIFGRCECGTITYEADCEIADLCHCHCSQCRRLHGAAYATFAGIDASKFRITAGEEALKKFASSKTNHRLFCGNCGSNILAAENETTNFVYLAMGTVDGSPDLPEAYHIYVASKAPWHDITDSAPQYEADV